MVKKTHHNWSRFWVPQGKSISLDGSGFLYDPEDEHALFYYTDYQPSQLSELGDLPVAVLLGEPGIGKSTALRDESSRLRAEGKACLYRELNQYSSDTRLIGDIFDSEEIQAWKQGKYHLMLLLDSLDECSLTIPSVVRILAGQLKDLPKERLSLRLTCRTVDWPTHFTDDLKVLWRGEDSDVPDPLGIFELAPLRKKDIRLAALDCSLDADAFLNEIGEKEIQPFASHPNTLNMLLDLFGRPEGLPEQRAELYRLGCERLAEELSTYRKESHYTGKFMAQQRMAVAGRIAAQMIFGHRSAIWQGDALGAVIADLVERDIVGGFEQSDGLDLPVDSHVFQETIQCALFSGHSEKRIGFAHQSYAEFLAAWHLDSHSLETQQLLALLRHPDDGRIPPQHTETAIWLTSLNKNIFTALVDSEPLLLLCADLFDASDDQKAQLTKRLLDSFAARTEFDRDWGLRQHYRKLAHPNLAVQLRPYVEDKSMPIVARRGAMSIAAACNVQDLRDSLVSIVLDQKEDQQHRLNAADAVIDLADSQQLASLRPVALGKAVVDPEDRLKAALISSLWPDHISTKEVFELLLQTQSVYCLGRLRYSRKEFVGQFSSDDLIIALQWITDIGNTREDYEIDRVKDAIMVEVWSRVNDPQVLRAFSDTAWACLGRYERVFNRRGERRESQVEQDDHKRRIAIIALLEAHADSAEKVDLVSLVSGEDQIILPQDADWLLGCYQAISDPALRTKLATCINYFVRWDAEIAWLDAVVTAACADAINAESPLADAIAFYLEPIELDSEAARTLKDQHARKMKRAQERPLPIDPPPSVRVEQALQEFESGKNNAWMRLWQELTLPDEATGYELDFDNIAAFPGWLRATPRDQLRIVRCAEAWVIGRPLTQEDIFHTDNSISHLHAATYLALCLLAEENPQFLVDSLENWPQWSEVIVAYSFDQNPEPRGALLKQAYLNAPETVLGTFRRLICQDISASLSLHRVHELTVIWDGRIAKLLNEFLIKPNLLLTNMSILLDTLLQNGDEAAFEFACDIVTSEPLVGPPNHPLMLVAAQSLATYQTRKAWEIIWKRVLEDSTFGESLMLGIAYHSDRSGSLFAGLTETQIAELYFWLEEHFPVAKDANYPSGKAHQVTARDEAGRLRDSCLNYLSGLGTQPAIDALQMISDRFPKRDRLRYLLKEAKRAFCKASLQALSPAELIAYTQRRDARLVRSSTELLEAVMFSLQRFQEKLRGQTPLAPFLWNLSADGKSGRPKSEDHLSDFIKHHLECDLPTFVIDREVQIRNLRGQGIGERTDLKVEAKDSDGRSLAVIIESKGCWNDGLTTDMQDQLSERYLKLVPEACGIYLVGWFRCERWKGKGNCVFKGTKEKLASELDVQAVELSRGNRSISSFVLDVSY